MIERLRRAIDAGTAARMLISLILAFALWAWVTNERDPEQSWRASDIPIEVEGLAPGLQLVHPLPAVDVSLQGPRSVVQRLDADDIRASVDLSEFTMPGTYTVEVNVDAPEGTRRVRSIPSEVEVSLDTVVQRVFTVEPTLPEQVPRNLSVSSMVATPAEVTVTGVQQNVDRISRVVAPVELQGRSDSFSTDVTLTALDESGAPVENITIEPSSVRVDVTVQVRGKEIPVFVRCGPDPETRCQAAEGYDVIGQPQAVPASVLIDGPREALDAVQFIYTLPIDTSTLREPTVLPNVPLATDMLPEGVTVEPATVNVSVRVEQSIFSRTFDNVPVLVINVPDGMRAGVSPSTASVTVEGPREQLASMQPSDIAIVVDASDLGVGTHQLRPLVMLPPRISYRDLPVQVVVTLVAETPAPAPTAAPPPAP